MPRRVYKHPLNISDDLQSVEVHGSCARVVSVAPQGDGLFAWIEQDISKSKVLRQFCVHGTGHDVRDGLLWVGTVHVPPFVWHVYSTVN